MQIYRLNDDTFALGTAGATAWSAIRRVLATGGGRGRPSYVTARGRRPRIPLDAPTLRPAPKTMRARLRALAGFTA